jgi:hypothetical protein
MTEDKENFLSGKSDFIGWYIKLKAQLEDRGYLTENGTITASTNETNFKKKTYYFIINSLSNSVAGRLSCAQTGSATMKFLQEKYGGGNAFETKNKYVEFKMQHHTDASKYLDILHGLKVTAKQSGAKIYPRYEFKKLVNDVNPNFYLDYVRNVRMKFNEKLE